METYTKLDIFEAIIDGDLEQFYYFCEKGQMNTKDGKGVTPLMMATRLGNLRMVEFLLKVGGTVNAKDKDQWSALMYACQEGNLEIANLLIEHKAHLDKRDTNGWTCLRIAIAKRHLSIVRLLLDEGANPNLKDNMEWTPIESAIWTGNVEMVSVLLGSERLRLGKKEWRDLFRRTASCSNTKILGLLMDAGMTEEDLLPNHKTFHAKFLGWRRRRALLNMRQAERI